MPFDPTRWRDRFHPGDLVFGLDSEVSTFIDAQRANGADDRCKVVAYSEDLTTATGAGQPADNVPFLNTLDGLPKFTLIVSDQATGHASAVTAANVSARNNKTWRLKSKGALYWATQKARKYCHFNLDGIDLASVPTKSANVNPRVRDIPAGKAGPADRDSKIRLVTHAELRWIYRNRANADVQEYVQFWLAGGPCLPPWRKDPAAWMAYPPSNPGLQ